MEKITASVRLKKTRGERNRLLKEGKVPGIMYGKSIEPVALAVNARELESLVERGLKILELSVEGKTQRVLVKELQHHPVTGKLIHVDFQVVESGRKIRQLVPVELYGEAAGVKAGGILEHGLSEVTVECLPEDLPESIEVDVSKLEVGDCIRVKDLELPPGVRVIEDPESVIALVSAPEEYVEEETEEAATAPEATA
ncbi:50S ribosomal protein L25 [Carboxydothermus islandicus]|uniref:Large ribosomal subunit protein bL25 n=1 Tax=Carboxydothermus islandicus TaxID=661089 RepID=A0A1L8D318_9THEO|nr:50S ribosomal protein L25 [Carboxydothermus islandicus]GAV25572.1 50S ribosomal protein L25 [Carboxydothermus islandicus]